MLKYQLIANQIEDHIYENDLPKGTKLPTVEQFASDYGVSKSTIVKALETLVLRVIVYQVQGSGIFVRKRNKKGYINFNSPKGFTDNLEEHKITSKLVDLDLVNPDDEICNHLECDKDEDVYVVKRIRYIDNEIMCYEESFYKKSIVPFLNHRVVQLYVYLLHFIHSYVPMQYHRVVQPQNNIGLVSGSIDVYASSPSLSGCIISPQIL